VEAPAPGAATPRGEPKTPCDGTTAASATAIRGVSADTPATPSVPWEPTAHELEPPIGLSPMGAANATPQAVNTVMATRATTTAADMNLADVRTWFTALLDLAVASPIATAVPEHGSSQHIHDFTGRN
jgi:hypothetical protein